MTINQHSKHNKKVASDILTWPNIRGWEGFAVVRC